MTGCVEKGIAVPCEYVGQFYPESDVDWVQFEAKKGGDVLDRGDLQPTGSRRAIR